MALSRICSLNVFRQTVNQILSKNGEQRLINYARLLSTTHVNCEVKATKAAPKYDFNRAVSDAEKIVGYPTSFLSLRWLLSDETANIALHLRKLAGSNHPLLKTAKNLVYNGKYNMQAWGLIVLLISKAAGYASTISDIEQDKSAGILHSQRALAEVTEMIRTAHLVHQGLINLQPLAKAGNELSSESEMILGNKIALLSGDYLLGNASTQIAGLRNHDLSILISSSERDLTESCFFGERDDQNNPLPFNPNVRFSYQNSTENASTDLDYEDEIDNTKPLSIKDFMGSAEKEWILRNILSTGSLLGKSCQGALMLAGQPEKLQKHGYLFGKHLALAWQSCIDMEPFKMNTLPIGAQFSLICAPVLFHLDHDPQLYDREIAKGRVSVDNIDYNKLHKIISNGPGLDKTRELQRKHSLKAMNALKEFPPSDARTALENIILAMQDI